VPAVRLPAKKDRHHRGTRPQGQQREPLRGGCRGAEERHEHPFGPRGVLVEQDAHHALPPQRGQDLPHRLPLDDELGPAASPEAGGQAIEERMLERARHDGQREPG
jgi:hypothetical protein